jgi:plasmid stabilization system protein ParE
VKVIWSAKAEEAIEEIKFYLIDNWSDKVANNFIKEVDEKIQLLKMFPEIGRVSEPDATVRKVLITKHLMLYYRIKKNKLEILGFFDQHQHPDKANY